MALSTVIKQLQKRESDARVAELDRPQLIETWRRDILDVYAAIRSAMTPYIEDGSAEIDDESVEVEEETLGVGTYPRLVIAIVARRIVVEPVARFTAGGSGRVDMYRENRPTEDHRVFIVRRQISFEQENSQWFIERKGEFLTRPPDPGVGLLRRSRQYVPLQSSAIEDAVEYLLKLS